MRTDCLSEFTDADHGIDLSSGLDVVSARAFGQALDGHSPIKHPVRHRNGQGER